MKMNKLIAEYMGVDQVDIDYAIDEHGELKYHKDWNWLMPVVQRVSEYLDEQDEQDLMQTLMYGYRDDVYKLIVEFIKEYNNK